MCVNNRDHIVYTCISLSVCVSTGRETLQILVYIIPYTTPYTSKLQKIIHPDPHPLSHSLNSLKHTRSNTPNNVCVWIFLFNYKKEREGDERRNVSKIGNRGIFCFGFEDSQLYTIQFFLFCNLNCIESIDFVEREDVCVCVTFIVVEEPFGIGL